MALSIVTPAASATMPWPTFFQSVVMCSPRFVLRQHRGQDAPSPRSWAPIAPPPGPERIVARTRCGILYRSSAAPLPVSISPNDSSGPVWAADQGEVLGHENMGIVEETGPGVSWIKPGDRVWMPFNIPCGTCRNCGAGFGDNHGAGLRSPAGTDLPPVRLPRPGRTCCHRPVRARGRHGPDRAAPRP